MNAKGHGIVHDVILGRDRTEHASHASGLFAFVDFGKPEMGFVFMRFRHQEDLLSTKDRLRCPTEM
jgi:hypothetical protein